MLHTFRFDASRFADELALATHVHAHLRDTIEEAEIAEPVREDGATVVWLDVGGDRYRLVASRDMGAQPALWCITIERPEPAFVRRGAGHARHRERFDALVAAVRTMILADAATHLVAESDD
jgi:hypothetical protein